MRALVEEQRKNWPQEIDVRYTQDKSSDIRTMLGDLQNNVISAILLVMIVVVGALGVRSGLLVGLAIPGSFLTGILVLQVLGLTVNIVVLFSLILSVGMLVDGAIVVTEYADRKLREGEPPARAYALAAKRMAWPIMASTATTLAAFAPLLFWPGIVGEFMKFLPITLVATLSASLLMALVFVPVVGANLGTIARILFVLVGVLGGALLVGFVAFTGTSQLLGNGGGILPTLVAAVFAVAGAIGGTFLGIRAGDMVNRALSLAAPASEAAQMQAVAAGSHIDPTQLRGLAGRYARVLSLALRHPGKVLGLAGVVLVGAWVLYAVAGKGVEFFPEVEPPVAVLQIHARGNLSVAKKTALVGAVEDRVLAVQAERRELDSIYTLAGNLGVQDDRAEDIIGTINLEFAEWDQRRPANVILADVIGRTADLGGIIVETRKQEAGPPVGKPVQVQLGSDLPELLDAEVAKVRAYMDGLAGLKDVEDSRPMPGIEWELAVDRAQAAKFGASIETIGAAVKLVTKGLNVTEYRPDDADDEIEITARFPLDKRTLDQLDQLRIQTSEGLVPISNFVSRRPIPRTGQLRRVDGSRVLTVQADVLPGVLASDMVQAITSWLPTAGIDPRVEIAFKGEDQEQKDAQAFLMKAFAVALFLMSIILVTQFNSFYSALLILSAVIMSTVGVLLGLLATGQPFGIIMSGIGVIALAGIVVNNNIVLIDTFDRLRKTVPDPRLAIVRTGVQRLRPVLLTSVTTILGLMPMVLQVNIDFVTRAVAQGAPSTQWWVQLAPAIVFGLAFATILTLIVTPCSLMVRANVQAWSARRRAGPAAPGQAADRPTMPPTGDLPQPAE